MKAKKETKEAVNEEITQAFDRLYGSLGTNGGVYIYIYI